MTLIELTVVLLILVALAGLALPYVSGTSRKALCDATDVSMMNIKQVIMQRYYLDTLGNFPVTKGSGDYSLNYLFVNGGWGTFDPDSQVGWNGPYLQGAQVLGSDLTTGNFDSLDYTKLKFYEGNNAVMDSWGRPFIIQVIDQDGDDKCWGLVVNEAKCARLVSAGSGSGLGISKGSIDTKVIENKQNDDRLLYLNIPTPASDINESCSD